MFRKSLISVVTFAVLATSAFSASTTTASASNRDRRAAAGFALGAAAIILGAAAYNSNHDNGRYYYKRKHRHAEYANERECFEKPVRKYDAYYGRKVIVGYRTVCR